MPRSSRPPCRRWRRASAWHRWTLSIGISAYLLALAVFVPVSGWAADRFGARHVFAGAVRLFTLASLRAGSRQPVRVRSPRGGCRASAAALHGRRSAGSWCCAARPRAACRGHRHDHLAGPCRAGDRAAARRLDRHHLELALDLLPQRAARPASALLALRLCSTARRGGRAPSTDRLLLTAAALAALMYGLDLLSRTAGRRPLAGALVAAASALGSPAVAMRAQPHPLIDLRRFGVPHVSRLE